jgi:hypothetical protein
MSPVSLIVPSGCAVRHNMLVEKISTHNVWRAVRYAMCALPTFRP